MKTAIVIALLTLLSSCELIERYIDPKPTVPLPKPASEIIHSGLLHGKVLKVIRNEYWNTYFLYDSLGPRDYKRVQGIDSMYIQSPTRNLPFSNGQITIYYSPTVATSYEVSANEIVRYTKIKGWEEYMDTCLIPYFTYPADRPRTTPLTTDECAIVAAHCYWLSPDNPMNQ